MRRRAFSFIFSSPALKSSPSPSLIPFVASAQSKLKLLSSGSEPANTSNFTPTQNTTSPSEVDDDASKVELKEQIDKFLVSEEGDEEAISSIFETILKRKLSGKHEESDNELMEEFQEKPIADGNEFPDHQSNSFSEEDVESFSDEEDEEDG